ncbi:sugar ABC transporter permease [Paenibacillus ferrarius]|uniref:Sugar ABC transporter permease n=1 Tax=Paenibacillus ferrarius TaxID=1469647 RepID=A0A1V4H602_9BACL|nr:sugar ABC transporter permease [Paenibacillus ferrarius]OPH46572.1 sugar ABC transporter permease [Paenibacillus ferrarius]
MYPFGKKWHKWAPYGFLLPALIIYIVFSFGPSMASIIYSFTDISGVAGVKWHFIGLDNYKEFFHSGRTAAYLASVKRTVIFSFAVTIVQTAIGLLLAIIINSKLKGHLFYRSLIFMPVVLGVTVFGLIWSLMFNPMDGPIQKLWGIFGSSSTFLGSYDLAFYIVVFIQIWGSLGYTVVIFLAGLQAIPGDLYEAGHIDGARAWQSFVHITWPMLASTATVNLLLAIIGSLQTYDVVFVLTQGNFNTSVLGYEIYRAAFGGTPGALGLRQGFASAVAVIQFSIVLVIAVIAQYYLRRREVQL